SLPARAEGEQRRCDHPERRPAVRLGPVPARATARWRGRIRVVIRRSGGRPAAASRRGATQHHPDPLIVVVGYWRLAGITSGLACAAGAGVGGLKYLPAGETGIFRSGAGGVLGLAGAVVSYAPPRVGGRWQLGIEARYDVHRFITPALRSEGFTSARTVHRIALALRAGRGRAAGAAGAAGAAP